MDDYVHHEGSADERAQNARDAATNAHQIRTAFQALMAEGFAKPEALFLVGQMILGAQRGQK